MRCAVPALAPAVLGLALAIVPALLGGHAGVARAEDRKEARICDTLRITSPEKISFSDTEKRFLCGDPKNPPWSEVPENEVRLFLISFLQARGFFQPTFDRDGQTLVVDVGDKSRIKVLQSAGVPPQMDFSRYWVPKRKPLTPGLLDEYQDLVRGRVESEGYPCPSVNATANAADGSMNIGITSGPRLRVISIDEQDVAGLKPLTLRRYFPIEVGDWYDGDLVYIANERIKAEDMLSSTYMVSNCTPEGATIEHRAVTGPPRRMTVGFGVNTETYFIFRSTYRNARVDANASRFDAILSANYFNQQLRSSFDWYFLPFPTSLHFQPVLSFERRNEESSEVRTTTASWHLAGYKDGFGRQWRLAVGPNLSLIRTTRGRGPDFARILELQASGQVMSHDYEFYRGSPRSGQSLNWKVTNASQRTYSTLTVRTFSADGDMLFNWAKLEPPLVVLGLRGGLQTTDAAPDVELPDQYLYYIGGSGDVRGFPRRSVPSEDAGARTAAYLGTEARVVTIFPYNLQPFVFVDAGKVGQNAFTLDPTLFYSPGAGMRWQSPFGSLRGSVARGMLAHVDQAKKPSVSQGWSLFVSFGEEF